MELREKIAREIDAASNEPPGHWPSWLQAADRILAIPDIAEAFEAQRFWRWNEASMDAYDD